MGMELLIAVIAVAVVAILWAIRKDMSIGDVNKDGKVDADDAKALANEVRDWANEATAEMKQAAEAVVEKAEEVAKAVTKSPAKKAAVRKAPAKKPAPKKVAAPKAPAKKVAPKKATKKK